MKTDIYSHAPFQNIIKTNKINHAQVPGIESSSVILRQNQIHVLQNERNVRPNWMVKMTDYITIGEKGRDMT